MSFTFKGKQSYKTSIGALVSIIIKAILLFYISYEFYAVFSRKHPIVSIQPIIDYDQLMHGIKPFERGFDIAIGVLNGSTDGLIPLDQTFGKILGYFSENKNRTPLTFQPCTSNNFQIVDSSHEEI